MTKVNGIIQAPQRISDTQALGRGKRNECQKDLWPKKEKTEAAHALAAADETAFVRRRRQKSEYQRRLVASSFHWRGKLQGRELWWWAARDHGTRAGRQRAKQVVTVPPSPHCVR